MRQRLRLFDSSKQYSFDIVHSQVIIMSSSKGFSAFVGRALRETGAALKLGGGAEVSEAMVMAW